MKKIIALNTLCQLIGKAVSAAATFVITVFVARQLGAVGYGDFIKITTYVAFFYLLVDFGMNAIFLQYDDREYWPALVTLRVIGSAVIILMALIILTLLPGSRSQGYTPMVKLGILLYSPTILLQGLIISGNAVFQKRLRYDLSAWSIFFGSSTVVLFLWKPTSLLAVIFIVLTGILVTAVFSFIFASNLTGRVRFSPTADALKRLFLPSIPLGIILLFNLVYFHADSVILALTRSTAEVGIYGLAYKVFEVALVFPTFFMNAVYPLLLTQRNMESGIMNNEFKRILKKSFVFLILTSLFMLLIVWFAAPLLSLINNDFAQSITALRVLLLGLPLFFVTSATMWALIALKKQLMLTFIYGISMAVNIIGNILLVPTYGFMAAAWVTVVSEGLVLLLSGIILTKEL